MYAQDYDEMILPWLLPPGATQRERLWTHLIQPYIKNGGGSPPDGVMRCPSWSEARLKLASNRPDCNGPGAIDPGFPPDLLLSHYGIATPMPVRRGDGTPQNPFFQYAGSGWISSRANPPQTYTSLPMVLRPSDTALVADGVTLTKGPGILSVFGCEAAEMHQEGGNFVFLDGHAKWVKGDAEKAVLQNAAGQWYKRYFTYSME